MLLPALSSVSAANATVNATSSTTDLTAPTIKTVDPTNKATNVAINKTIKVTFSETIKTGNYWIELKNSNGKTVSITKSITGNVLTIKPTNNLTKATKYTVIIHTGSLTDLSGNKIALCTSTFTTDCTAPTIKTVDPINKATNVVTSKTIKVTFTEAIKTGNYWIELKNSAGKTVALTKSINGNTLTIKPTSSLTRGTKYTVIIHTGSLTDLSGNNIALCTSTFTTDSTAPTIKTVDPANKATNIVVNKVIKVTFSEAIKTGNYWIELKDTSGKIISLTKSISNNILTIIPTSNLTKATRYTVIIHTGSLTDLSGNNIALCTSTFTTDCTAPTIKTVDPTNKATKVAVNKVIKVTFTEAIKAGNYWIELIDTNGNAVSFAKSISGNVLTIKPTTNLTYGTKYTVIIHTGSLTDLSGNNIALCTSKFTTKSTNGIWLPSSYASTVNMTALTKTGITDIFIKVSQTNYKSVLTTILNRVSGTGINIHAWITCFKYSNDSWANPQNSTYVNNLISFISSVTQYSANGLHVAGIHLDYVRYPGTTNNKAGTSGTAAITAFVQKVYNTVNSINSSVKVSAALMPECSVNGYYYGQDYAQLAKYLDFMVIMAYKGNYGYDSSTGTNSNGKSGADWISSTIEYIVSQANGTPVIAGLQTYRSDDNVKAIPASELQNDINAAVTSGSQGYVLFRYGLIDEAFMDI